MQKKFHNKHHLIREDTVKDGVISIALPLSYNSCLSTALFFLFFIPSVFEMVYFWSPL